MSLQYDNAMDGFSLRKFNTRTTQLIGKPELADSPAMMRLEAHAGICGIREMAGYY